MKENILLQSNEEIRSIQGYEGIYSITSFGRVWSYEKIRRFRIYEAKFLKLGKYKNNYLIVGLHKNNKQKTYSVYCLEAQAFIPNPLNLPEVNHKDGNKQNNYVGIVAENYMDGNLEWCTSQENANHASMCGLRKYKKYSKFYGVSFYKNLRNRNKPWCTQTTINKKQKCIGCFKTEIEAAKVYNNYIIRNNLNSPLNYLVEG